MTTNWQILRASIETLRDNATKYALASTEPTVQIGMYAQVEVLEIVLSEMTTIEADDG